MQSTFGRYSAVNALLILAQKPEAARLGSFDYWKSQNGFVKPGQSGISILEPLKEYEREDGSTAVGYNVKKVFDISQIDARELNIDVNGAVRTIQQHPKLVGYVRHLRYGN